MKKWAEQMVDAGLRDFDVPDDKCPACGHETNGAMATQPGSPAPRPGDLSVCFKCGVIVEFNSATKMRLLSEYEIGLLDADTREHLVKVQKAIADTKSSQDEELGSTAKSDPMGMCGGTGEVRVAKGGRMLKPCPGCRDCTEQGRTR